MPQPIFTDGQVLTGPGLTGGFEDEIPKDGSEDAQAIQVSGTMLAGPGSFLGNQVSLHLHHTNPGTNLVPLALEYAPTSDRGSAGYSGMSQVVALGTISQNPDNSGSRFNTEFVSIQLLSQTTAGTGSVGHSAVGTHVTKTLPIKASGTAYAMGSSDTLAACWSLYGTAVDQSNLPTSKAGPLACQEYDMQVNCIDDQGVRGGYAFNADCKTQLSAGGIPATIAQGFYSYGLGDAWIWTGHRTAGNHIMSAHDCRAINGPETTVRVTSTGTTVAVSNVTPYTIGSNDFGIGLTLGGAGSNPIYNVKIGANTYQVNAATQDAPGLRSGTLTLSAALQGTDGNAGNGVARPFYALIMRTGDRIGFDYNGNVQAFYDSSVFGGGGGIHLTSSVWVDGNINATGSVTATSFATSGPGSITVGSGNSIIYGPVEMVAPITFNDGLAVTGGGLGLPAYWGGSSPPTGKPVVPNVGSFNPGSVTQLYLIWIVNACKPGEASGSGTGVIAHPNNNGTQWVIFNTNTTVTY